MISKRRVETLAEHFRSAIDIAVQNNVFPLKDWMRHFPSGCCDDARDLLAFYLKQNGIETAQINGVYRDEAPENITNHVWLKTQDGLIIDITGDQFQFRPELLNYSVPVYVGDVSVKSCACRKSNAAFQRRLEWQLSGSSFDQGRLFVRIMGFGNGSLAALYDRSDGFYRRQIALQVKNKNQDRIDDTKLGDKLIEEAEGIALWMPEGLHRLIRNDYKFTISSRTARNMDDIRKSDNNMMEFYESEGYIRFDKSCHATTKRIYGAYVQWCQENVEKPLAEKTFTQQLRKDAEILGITYDKNLDTGGGKKARGYHGINVMVNTENRFL